MGNYGVCLYSRNNHLPSEKGALPGCSHNLTSLPTFFTIQHALALLFGCRSYIFGSERHSGTRVSPVCVAVSGEKSLLVQSNRSGQSMVEVLSPQVQPSNYYNALSFACVFISLLLGLQVIVQCEEHWAVGHLVLDRSTTRLTASRGNSHV